MQEGRGRILIVRSLYNRNFQKSLVEKVLNYLNDVNEKHDGEEVDKKAEELTRIIDDSKNSEMVIQKVLDGMINSL